MSDTLDQAIKQFLNDWVSHLGNSMTSETRDAFTNEMRRIAERPYTPMEYLISVAITTLPNTPPTN